MIIYENFAGHQFYGIATSDGACVIGLPYMDSQGNMIGYLIYKKDSQVSDQQLKNYGMEALSKRGTSGMIYDLVPMPYNPIAETRVVSALTAIVRENANKIKGVTIKLPVI